MRHHALTLGAFACVCLSGCALPAREARIESVTFLPEIWGEPARRANVLYQDGALPTAVPGGTLWTFGDTFMGAIGPDAMPRFAGAHSNTIAFLPAGATGWPPALEYFSAGADGAATPPLALLPDESEKTRRLWPLAGVWLGDPGRNAERAGRAFMFYGLIEITGPGPWGFKGVGTGLARASTPLAVYQRVPTPSSPGNAGPGWPIDASSLVRRDGYLYLYVPRRFRGEQDLSSGLLVARVPECDIEDPTRYEFFAGLAAGESGGGTPRWTAGVEDAVPAAEDVWGQASVAWNAWLGAYVLATSSNFFRHDQIQIRQAPTPWGPWTPIAPADGFVSVPEREGEQTQLIYCTMLHPELDEQHGRVITLTFCRMLKRDWALTNPEGVRVEFAPMK